MNPIEAKLASSVLGVAAGPAQNALKRWGQRKYDQFIVNFTKAFFENVQKSRDKCKTVRNVLYRNQLAKTDDKYVSISFRDTDFDTVPDTEILSRLLRNEKVLIRGRGGAGKTMFTKWTVLRLVEDLENHQRIPIYVELRDLKDSDSDEFEQILFRYFTTSRSKSSFTQFVEGLKVGLFVFVLDAADEIDKRQRSDICRKIERFQATFPECAILLTSRDFAEIENIHGFTNYQTRPLERNEAIKILEKLDYDEEVRDALIEYIRSEKTERHSYFLQNPLLVTIMLLTFDQSKDIPNKRSIFYKRAFEALYERHDASKGIFRRDHHARLPLDEFERVFSAFCYGTYINSQFDFSIADLNRLFKLASNLSDVDVKAEDVAKDAHESVCLLVKEGHDFTFCHRSFQEYFVAVYLRDYRDDDIEQLYQLALRSGQGENVLEFIFEMDQVSLERRYVLPRLSKIVDQVQKRMENENDILAVLRFFVKAIRMKAKSLEFTGWTMNNEDDARFIFAIDSIFGIRSVVNALIDLNTTPLMVRNFPREIAKSTRSYKMEHSSDWSTDIIELKTTPSAAAWFPQSEMHELVRDFWVDILALHSRLKDKYSDANDRSVGRFAGFLS